MKKQYTLQYINKAGDIIARDYFSNKEEAIEFAKTLINTYKHFQDYYRVYALYIEDENGMEIFSYGITKEELVDNSKTPVIKDIKEYFIAGYTYEVENLNQIYDGCTIFVERFKNQQNLNEMYDRYYSLETAMADFNDLYSIINEVNGKYYITEYILKEWDFYTDTFKVVKISNSLSQEKQRIENKKGD